MALHTAHLLVRKAKIKHEVRTKNRQLTMFVITCVCYCINRIGQNIIIGKPFLTVVISY